MARGERSGRSSRPDAGDLKALSRLFSADAAFLEACLHEGEEPDPRRLRRLQRICAALEVEPDIAALIADMSDRIAELERLLRQLGG